LWMLTRIHFKIISLFVKVLIANLIKLKMHHNGIMLTQIKIKMTNIAYPC